MFLFTTGKKRVKGDFSRLKKIQDDSYLDFLPLVFESITGKNMTA
jgi:hypothetical protein